LAVDTPPLYSFDNSDPDLWKNVSKEKLLELVGPCELPELVEPTRVWSAADKHGSYEKLLLVGEYGSIIPIYRCIPTNRRATGTWVICVQGHNSGMHNSIEVDLQNERYYDKIQKGRSFVRWCFDNGFAAVCLEQRCFGERQEVFQTRRSNHPCHDAVMKALVLGRTLMGERLSDIKLCINYINKFCDNESEKKRIGIMGNSLGGSVSIYANSLIDEIDFAIACSCVSSLDESIMKIYHCGDLYIPKLRKYFEFGEIAGLAAPKPLIVVQGDEDPIFPFKGMQIAVERISEIYSQFGASSNLVVKVVSGGHSFYHEATTAAVKECSGPL